MTVTTAFSTTIATAVSGRDGTIWYHACWFHETTLVCLNSALSLLSLFVSLSVSCLDQAMLHAVFASDQAALIR